MVLIETLNNLVTDCYQDVKRLKQCNKKRFNARKPLPTLPLMLATDLRVTWRCNNALCPWRCNNALCQ